jgi:hypothetical protein
LYASQTPIIVLNGKEAVLEGDRVLAYGRDNNVHIILVFAVFNRGLLNEGNGEVGDKQPEKPEHDGVYQARQDLPCLTDRLRIASVLHPLHL